jgi:hypothetical protein
MNVLSQYIAGALALIALYLLVVNASGSAQVINSLAGANTSAIRALQGR